MEDLNQVLRDLMANTPEVTQELGELEREELNKLIKEFINEEG